MPISDDAIMTLAKNVGEVATKVGDLAEVMKSHMTDPQAHSGTIPRIASLEKSRRWFRRAAVASIITAPAGGTVAAKMGWVGKVMAAVAETAVGGGS